VEDGQETVGEKLGAGSMQLLCSLLPRQYQIADDRFKLFAKNATSEEFHVLMPLIPFSVGVP
jgi:hypothetical protein